MCGTGCCELNPNPLQKEEERGREPFKTVQSSISLMSFRILAFLFSGPAKENSQCGQWLPGGAGVELGVKVGALLLFFTRFMIPRDSPNHIQNIQLHMEFLLLLPVCLTRHLLSFKNNHLDFVFLVNIWVVWWKEPPSRHLQSWIFGRCCMGFFSWNTCGLTVYRSDNLLHHAA